MGKIFHLNRACGNRNLETGLLSLFKGVPDLFRAVIIKRYRNGNNGIFDRGSDGFYKKAVYLEIFDGV